MKNKLIMVLVIIILLLLLLIFGLLMVKDKEENETSNDVVINASNMEASSSEENAADDPPEVNDTSVDEDDAMGEVIFSHLENFDDGFIDDWKTYQYVTLKDNPKGVYFEDGQIRLVAEETDLVPILASKPYPINNAKYLTIKLRMKTNFANDYYTGSSAIFFTDDPSTEIMVGTNHWSENFGRRSVFTEYVNYDYSSSQRIIKNGFIYYGISDAGTSVEAFTTGAFDTWFDQEFKINLETGQATCTIEGQTLESQVIVPDEAYFRLWIHPYGWYTGHEIVIDAIEITLTQ